jgi:intracellular septation protein A
MSTLRPLLVSIRPLVYDSLGAIAFAILMAFHVPTTLAVLAGASIALAIVASDLVRRRPIPALQWMSLVVVLVPAAATLLTHDPRFVMAKPTIIYLAIGTTMLRRGWMQRYLASYSAFWNPDLIDRFGFIWAALMYFTALANLVVAVLFPAWWPTFIGLFPITSKLALFLTQYTIMRSLARRPATPLPVAP